MYVHIPISICLIHVNTYVCVCEYPYIEFIQWEVKKLKAFGDLIPFIFFGGGGDDEMVN